MIKLNKSYWQYEGSNKKDYCTKAVRYIINKGWTYSKFMNELRLNDIQIPDQIKRAIQLKMA
jgi:hypothetical protein